MGLPKVANIFKKPIHCNIHPNKKLYTKYNALLVNEKTCFEEAQYNSFHLVQGLGHIINLYQLQTFDNCQANVRRFKFRVHLSKQKKGMWEGSTAACYWA